MSLRLSRLHHNPKKQKKRRTDSTSGPYLQKLSDFFPADTSAQVFTVFAGMMDSRLQRGLVAVILFEA